MISPRTEVVRSGTVGAWSVSGVAGLLAAFGVSVAAWAAVIVAAVLLLG